MMEPQTQDAPENGEPVDELAERRDRIGKRLQRGKRWHTVTNEMVVACAAEGCEECGGTGQLYPDATDPDVCVCAQKAFQTQYADRLRLTRQGRMEVRL